MLVPKSSPLASEPYHPVKVAGGGPSIRSRRESERKLADLSCIQYVGYGRAHNSSSTRGRASSRPRTHAVREVFELTDCLTGPTITII